MSSILTNASSMVALQTLKAINKGMAKVQDEISTGLKVATAKDNGAVWAIAQTMKSDVRSLTKVEEALSLGSATVGTARTAAESISEMLSLAKEYVLGGGDLSNTDTRTKLLADLASIGDQIDDIVASASFNGVNLVDGDLATADVVGSITRDTAGAIGTETITVTGVDLSAVGAVLTLADADLLDAAAIAATLTTIEAELTTVNDAAAAFGTSQKQIEIAVGLRRQLQGGGEERHRRARRRRHGGGLGPPRRAADPAAARHPGADHRQPGAAEHPGAVPLIG